VSPAAGPQGTPTPAPATSSSARLAPVTTRPETPTAPFEAFAGDEEGVALSVLAEVRTPRSLRVLAAVLTTLLVASTLALVMLPWQQTVVGDGRVVAFSPLDRRQTIEAPIEGRVVRWFVREGSRVAANDPVVEISDNDPEILARLALERDATERRALAARARALALEEQARAIEAARAAAVTAATERVGMAQDRIRAAEQTLDAALATSRTADWNIVRQEKLASLGGASRRTFELAQLERDRARAEVERARAALSAARREEASLRMDRERITADVSASLEGVKAAREAALADAAAADAAKAPIETRLARQSTMLVRAPRAGTIFSLAAFQGAEMIRANDPLATLVPDTDARAVELWVDGNDVPLITEGRTARLQFEGWPAFQFSGWPSVAVGTFPGKVALVDATDNGKGKFRIVIVPESEADWPSARFLRQGGRAHGWVLLEQVGLGWELWRQFNGFPPVVTMDEPVKGKPSTLGPVGGGK